MAKRFRFFRYQQYPVFFTFYTGNLIDHAFIFEKNAIISFKICFIFARLKI